MDLQSLRQRIEDGENFDYLLFWGHQPSKDGSITKSCFSQWFVSPFYVDGVTYPTAEHWMMAGKAKLFGDEEMLAQILEAPDPKTAKALGRKVRNFDGDLWKQHCRQIVTEGNVHKFGQRDDLKRFLLGTGDAVIVEASPRDRIWGIGMGASNENATNPVKWRGQNLLGFALMDVRRSLL